MRICVGSSVPEIRTLQQNGIGDRFMVAIKAISTSNISIANICYDQKAYMRTCTLRSVRADDVAKEKASMTGTSWR